MTSTLISTKLFVCLLGATNALSLPRTANLLPQGSLVRGSGSFGLTTVPKPVVGSAIDRFQAERNYLSTKYGVNLLPGTLVPRAGPGTSNPAVPVNVNLAYSINLNIGGQHINLDPDTGSNILWVPDLKTAGGKGNPVSWDPSRSPTSFSVANSSWAIRYASPQFDVSGQVWGDNIYWDDVGPSAQLPNAGVYFATQSQNNQSTGILGLDHNMVVSYTVNGVAKTQPTFFQQVIPTLPSPLFTVNFKNQANGTIDFGFINASSYTGSIEYLVSDPTSTLWQTKTKGYSIAGGPSNITRSITTIIDTGSSSMYLPKDIVTQYWNQVNGSMFVSNSYWVFPCTAKLPDLTVYINSKPVVTPGRYFNIGGTIGGNCLGGLQNNFLGNELSLWGDAWIKSQYLVFMNATSTDSNAYIGIANKTLTT